MPHREYIRLVPGADTAVLFLHGIAGTPRHFDARLPLVHLVPENWSVYTVLWRIFLLPPCSIGSSMYGGPSIPWLKPIKG